MNLARTDKIDKQLQTRNKTTPKVSSDPEWEKCRIVEMYGSGLYYDNTDRASCIFDGFTNIFWWHQNF